MWNATLYVFRLGEWERAVWSHHCDEQYRYAHNCEHPFALVRADGVVIAQSVGADVRALKAEAA